MFQIMVSEEVKGTNHDESSDDDTPVVASNLDRVLHRETDLSFYLGKNQGLPDLGKNLGKNQGFLLPSKNLG